MKVVKKWLIKLRSIIFCCYWFLFRYQSFKQEMNKIGVHGLKVTRLDLWTTEVLFFTGVFEKKDVFTKLYLDNNKSQRESRVLEYIAKYKSNILLPKLINDGICLNGYFVVAEKIDAVNLTSIINTLSLIQFQGLVNQFILILDDFKSIGIVHCDITPSNVLVNNQGDLIIIDFEYSVCKNNSNYKDLTFENKTKLKSLGGVYAQGNFIWDDAYSFLSIAKEAIFSNNFVENELIRAEQELNVLESRVGLNQYKY